MESRRTSLIARKRKQPQSSSITTPLFSSFNRSKSLRSDIAFTSPADDEDSSRHTVKILRSRRVFSPDPRDNEEDLRNSIPDSCESHQNLQTKQSESTFLNQGSSGFNSDAENCSSGMLNPVDDGVNVQTTPPEAVVGGLEAAAIASQVADPAIPVEPAAKYKGRLNPQFRGRLVKSPVSFSYRRLLPYLMDIAKVDDSGATTANACKKQQNTQGGTTPIQKVPEDVICCNGDNPTANGSSKEEAAIIGHVNGGSSSPSDESPRDLSPPIVMNHTCSSESKGQYLKDGEDEGKFDHSSGNGKVPAENKPVEEDILLLHPLNNKVEEISKPCLKEEETNGTKKVVLMSQVDNSDCSGVSGEQGNNRLLQSSTLHSNNVDFVTSTVSMKSIDKSPLKNKKMLLNPCSRLKLSKSTNNSFSYKRLLPYLMEIAKDNSGAASESPSRTEEVKKTQQHSPPHQQFEEQVALTMPPPSTIIISSSDSILLKDDNNVSPTSISIAVESSQGLVLEAAVSTTTTRSCDEKLELANEKEKKVDSISPVVEQPLISGSPDTTTKVDRLILVQEEEASPPKSERESSRIGQVGSTTTKGILKRKNPRGCRGLCTCLSCSSFRLNAEKAFEFSRNQMKDSEEVAFALMEEVSHLRNVLQKLNNTTHQVMSNDQVEDACVRASQVEEAAKDRLRLMNEELNIHCRIKCLHPPSVTFKEPPSVAFDKP